MSMNWPRNWDGPLCDSHVHLFPEKLLRAIYGFFRQHYGWELPFPADPDRLAVLLQEQGVGRAFALAYIHKPDLSRSLNRWLYDFSARNPWLVPFGAVHPLDRDLKLVLKEALVKFKFAGLKLHFLVMPYRPDDERLFPVYEALLEQKRALVLHAGSFPLPAEDRLGSRYVLRLLSRYPGLQLVVSHLGLYDLEAYREMLEAFPGLYLDTAFIFQNEAFPLPMEQIRRLILDFPGRILHGSDFPFIAGSPLQGVARLLQWRLPEQIYRQLFYANALSFLKPDS